MPQLDEKDIKVIRLDNGEILFSKVLVTDKSKDNGYLELHWPMRVLVKHDDDTKQIQLALLKWLPFTDTTFVPLAARCIMSVSNLGEEYKEFYLNTVRETNEESTNSAMERMSKVLADFEPTGPMN